MESALPSAGLLKQDFSNTHKYMFHQAIQQENYEKIKELVEQDNMHPTEELSEMGNNWSAIHYASQSNKKQILQYLLFHAYQLYTYQFEEVLAMTTKDGWTALMLCCIYKCPQCLDVFIQVGGSNLQAKDDLGRTAMDLAKYYGAIECYEKLLKLSEKGITDLIPINKEQIEQLIPNLTSEINKISVDQNSKSQLLLFGERNPCYFCQKNTGYIKYTGCCGDPIHLLCFENNINEIQCNTCKMSNFKLTGEIIHAEKAFSYSEATE